MLIRLCLERPIFNQVFMMFTIIIAAFYMTHFYLKFDFLFLKGCSFPFPEHVNVLNFYLILKVNKKVVRL